MSWLDKFNQTYKRILIDVDAVASFEHIFQFEKRPSPMGKELLADREGVGQENCEDCVGVRAIDLRHASWTIRGVP